MTVPTIDWSPLADVLAAKPVPFDVLVYELPPGANEPRAVMKRYYLAWPTTAQYDDAQMLYEVAERAYLASDLLRDLRGAPAPELQHLNLNADIDQATLLARVYAALRRDRWLVAQLLCDEQGRRLCDTSTPEGLQAWERLPLAVKDAARPVLWRMLDVIRDLPFVSAPPNGSGSDSPPGSA